MLDCTFNPYLAPCALATPPLVKRSLDFSASELSVTCFDHGWLTRTLQINGRICARLRYNGWVQDGRVALNGKLVGTPVSSFYLTAVHPCINFQLSSDGGCYESQLFLRASYLQFWKLTHFTLVVGGELLYDEQPPKSQFPAR